MDKRRLFVEWDRQCGLSSSFRKPVRRARVAITLLNLTVIKKNAFYELVLFSKEVGKQLVASLSCTTLLLPIISKRKRDNESTTNTRLCF